jgi:hypothetical protein
MLVNNFEGRPGERYVRNGRFLILNNKIPTQPITADTWSKFVFPGSEICMFVILAKLHRQRIHCVRPGCLGMPTSLSGKYILKWSVNNGWFKHTLYLIDPSQECGLECTQGIFDSVPGSSISQDHQAEKRIKRNTSETIRLYRGASSSLEEEPQPAESTSPSSRIQNKGEKVTAQVRIANLAVCIRAIIILRRLLTRMRKQEEDGLKVFKSVHIRTHPNIADIAPDLNVNLNSTSLGNTSRVSSSILEYLVAGDGVTLSAGPHSFTTALIWALTQLHKENSFTTAELLQRTKNAPEFPKSMQPLLFQKLKSSPNDISTIANLPLSIKGYGQRTAVLLFTPNSKDPKVASEVSEHPGFP